MEPTINNRLSMAESCSEIGVLESKRKKSEGAIQAFQKAEAAFKKIGARKEVKKVTDQIISLERQKR